MCKNSKRCLNLLDPLNDSDYIKVLKLPDTASINPNITAPFSNIPSTNFITSLGIGQELTNLTPSFKFSDSILIASLNKHKTSTSTPHQNLINKNLVGISPSTGSNNKILAANSESKVRVLTSSLKASKSVSNSVSKSVKFQLKKYTREISKENREFNDYEDDMGCHDPNEQIDTAKKLFTEDDNEQANNIEM